MQVFRILGRLLLLSVSVNGWCQGTVYKGYNTEITFPLNGKVSSTWGSTHLKKHLFSGTVYSQTLNFGFVLKDKKAELIKDLESPEIEIAKIDLSSAPEISTKTEVYYGQSGKRKDIKYQAHVFIDAAEDYYLHFEIDKSDYYYQNAIEFLTQILQGVKLNAQTADGKLLEPNLSGLEFEVFTNNDQRFMVGNEGAQPMLRQGPGDDLFLLWPDITEEHKLTQLNLKGEIVKEYDFGTSEIYDAYAHEDGFVVLISHPNMLEGRLRYHHLYLEKYNYKQEKIWSTHLMGIDNIEKVGDQRFAYWGESSTRLAWSGEYYAVYFASYRKWPDRVTHQGDVFLTLTPEGVLMYENDDYYALNSTWDVSHSFAQELIFDGEKFYRMALGDAYPRAINLERSYPVAREAYNWRIHNAKTGSFSKFPGEIGDNYVFDTDFAPPILADGNVLFAYTTEFKVNGVKDQTYGKSKCNDLFLTFLDTTCNVTKSFRLTTTPKFDEQKVSIAYLGNDELLVKFRRIDPRPKGATENNARNGEWQEMLMLYDLKSSNAIKIIPIEYEYNSKKVKSFSLSNERTPYSNCFGDYGKMNQTTPLFTHKNGQVYMAKFLLEGSGLQLVEIGR
ncbi:MAG: hypothetical protein KDC92_04925 [Bacteroidetes bacterium]|nr:hypothetical protein [Bacteroidota bacterium]